MKRGRHATIVGSMVVAATMVCGCAASVPATSTRQPTGPSTRLYGSLAHDYSSIAQLKSDSPQVVVGYVSKSEDGGPADQDRSSDIHARLTSISVIDAPKGAIGQGSIVIVRQLSDPATNAPIDFLLEPGKTYLLFLQPFTFGPGTSPTGQYVITGEQGAYTLAPSGLSDPSGMATLVEGIHSGLPRTTSLASLTAR